MADERRSGRAYKRPFRAGCFIAQLCAFAVASFCIWLIGGENGYEYLLNCGQREGCCSGSQVSPHVPHQYALASYSTWDSKREWKMAVRPGAPGDYDLVSAAVRAAGQYGPQRSAGILETLKRTGEGAVLLDIGAHVGWYTLLAAYSGYDVIAIEPFTENIQLLNASLCVAPPAVRKRVALYNIALGAPPADGATCELWQQPKGNRGNTYTMCGTGDFSFQELNALRSIGYKALGSVRIRALDELFFRDHTFDTRIIEGDKLVVKIDIAGWEPMALAGTKEVLAKYKPKYIFSNFSPQDIRRAALTTGSTARESRWKAAEFLSYMEYQGYSYKLHTRAYNSSQDILFTRKPEAPQADVQQQQVA